MILISYINNLVKGYAILSIFIVLFKHRSDAVRRKQFCYDSNKSIYDSKCHLMRYVFCHQTLLESSIKDSKNSIIYSSVWCHENKLSKMSCHFRNLCYIPKENDFLFLIHPSSIISGVDNIKEITENLYLTSVNNHNAFKMRLVTGYKIDTANNVRWFVSKFLLFAKFKPDNIYHVIHDDLLPLYFTLKELTDMVYSKNHSGHHTKEYVLGLVNNSYKYDILYNFLFKEIISLTDLDHNLIYCFKSAYAGINKMSVWYDYGFTGTPEPTLNNNFNRNHMELFKSDFMNYFGIKRMYNQNYSIILSRKTTRKILNEVEIFSILQISLTKFDTSAIAKVISIENNDLLDIITYMLSTKLLIGVHGAGLILALFMPSGSSVIEIWPYGLNLRSAPIYSILCKIMGIHYIPWINKDFINTQINVELSPSHLFNQRYYNKLEMNEHLQNEMGTVPCCDNAEWLLRLNQDTFVNIYENHSYKSIPFQHVLLTAINVYNNQISENRNTFYNRILASVSGAHCEIQHKKNFSQLNVRWEKPWNLSKDFCSITTYEVVLDAGNGKSYRYIASELHIYKKFPPLQNDYINIWITALCDEELGNTFYKKCY